MNEELYLRYPSLKKCRGDIEAAVNEAVDCYRGGGKLLLCGNGGSSADCEHITGELLKGFLSKRPIPCKKKAEMLERCPALSGIIEKLQGGLPAIALPQLTALNTAFCNDVDPELLYAQGVMGLGKPNDVLIAISTSGNAKNVCNAAKAARGLGITVIALTGEGGGELYTLADVCIRVPEHETYKVQELHLPVYHYLSLRLEEELF